MTTTSGKDMLNSLNRWAFSRFQNNWSEKHLANCSLYVGRCPRTSCNRKRSATDRGWRTVWYNDRTGAVEVHSTTTSHHHQDTERGLSN